MTCRTRVGRRLQHLRSKAGANEEGRFKTLRDFKAPSIDKLVFDEALFNTGLSQADPRGEYCSCLSFLLLLLRLLTKCDCLQR